MTGSTKKGLGKSISIGALWMLGVRLSIKGLGLISSIILARLLMPADFGIVALAMSVYALIRLIRQFGFGFALIQNQEATRVFYDTAWTLQLILSTIAALILVALGPWAASFYEDEQLLPVFMALAFMFFVTGFESVGVIDFQKYMDFDKVFLVQVTPKILSFIVTVVLAFSLKNYWALVIGMLVNKVSLIVVGYVMHDYRPRFKLDAWRQLVGFSSWLLINNMIKYLNRHGQNIVLAKFGGPPLVGLLSVATEFASFVANEIVQPINTAAYPGYSSVADNKEVLRKTFSDVIEVVAFIAIPGAIGIAVLAPLFVPVLLGDKWLEAIAIIPNIAYASIFMSIMSTFDMVFVSIARQRITTFLVAFRVLLFFPLMYWLYQIHGAPGVAEAVLLSNLITFPLYFPALKRCVQLPLIAMLRVMVRPLIAAVAMYFSVAVYIDYLGPMQLTVAGFAALLSAVILGALTFVGCALLIWQLAGAPQGLERRVVSLVLARARVLIKGA